MFKYYNFFQNTKSGKISNLFPEVSQICCVNFVQGAMPMNTLDLNQPSWYEDSGWSDN
jgi:hypothetical protein